MRIVVFILFICLVGCNGTDDVPQEVVPLGYRINDNRFEKDGIAIHLKGVNAFNSFGVETGELMADWQVSIVREFIGNLNEQPISGAPILDRKGQFLHSLEAIVQEHRQNNRVTIICPFGWVDENGEQTLLTGLNPSETSFYEDYKVKMREIATYFKGQDDVWFEVWNEPYHFNGENGYTDDLWLNDHIDMVNNLRAIDGFDNIILVQGNEQGQGETVLFSKGGDLLNRFDNIAFDLHAYGKWHDGATVESMAQRLNAMLQAGLPIIFGEVGVITENAGLSDPTIFLNAVQQLEISTLAWAWQRDETIQNALLTTTNMPNDNNNGDWGSNFRVFLLGD